MLVDSKTRSRSDVWKQGLRIWRDVIDAGERETLLEWALDCRPHLDDNGPGRNYRQTDTLPGLPDVYHTVRLRLQARLGLIAIEREPMFGWYLSIIDHGGAVHSHVDPTQPGRRHLRCNIFLQLPRSGGFPIIEGQAHPVEAGDMLAFFANERRHRSQQVEGGDPRIICSFGYLVPMTYRLPAPDGAEPALTPVAARRSGARPGERRTGGTRPNAGVAAAARESVIEPAC